jgi:hypothetical protein
MNNEMVRIWKQTVVAYFRNMLHRLGKIMKHLRTYVDIQMRCTWSGFFFFSFSGWGEAESIRYVGKYLAYLYQPRMIDDECGVVGGMRIGGEIKLLWENLPQCHFVHHGSMTKAQTTKAHTTVWAFVRSPSTTNPTWPDLGSYPGRRGGKPATNRLSYGTAFTWSVTTINGGAWPFEKC